MKLQQLTEMAAKKVCPTCGHGMAGFHYWYKGAWKCKSTSLANPNVAAASAATQSAPATVTPQSAPTPAQSQATPDLTTPIGGVQKVDHTPIKYFLNTNYITNYTIEEDGTVNVNGNVVLDNLGSKFPELPVQFGEVTGDFTTIDVAFRSFKGFPKKVGGHFVIKKQISVQDYTGAPTHIGGMGLMKAVKAQSLQGFPEYIAKHAEFAVSGDKHDITRIGEFGGSVRINVEDAPLPSLDGIQSTINGSFEVMSKGLSSLEDFPSEVKGYVTLVLPKATANKSTSRMHKHIKQIGGRLALLFDQTFDSRDKKTLPPLLSVVLIKGITEFTFAPSTFAKSSQTSTEREFERQINNAIAEDQDIHELQEQLIDAGFTGAARL